MDFFPAEITLGGLLVVALACAWLGCDAGVGSEEPPLEAVAAAQEAREAEEEPEGGVIVVARVYDREIRAEEVEARVDRIAELYRHNRRVFDEDLRGDKRVEVVHRLIDEELIRHHLVHQGVTVEADEVDRTMERKIEKRFGSSSAFQRYLNSEGITASDFRRRVHDEVALRRVLLTDLREQTGEAEEFDEAEEERLREAYDRIVRRRPAGERVRASTLSIRVPTGADDETRERIRHSLEGSLGRLESAEGFRDLAETIGQGPNSARAEQLGWLERHQISPAAAPYLFDGEEGGLTPIVETPFGFEVFWVHERRGAGVREFDEVEELLRERDRRTRLEQGRQQLIRELRREATIEVDPAYDPR